MRSSNWDKFEIIINYLHKNIFCDTSLEPSRQDSSNEGSQCMFSLRIRNIIFELFSISPDGFFLNPIYALYDCICIM